MIFEKIDDWNQRAKVFEGWVVRTHERVYHPSNGYSESGDGWDWRISTCFVPDKNHEWELPPKEQGDE
jgi:hypothetical protein